MNENSKPVEVPDSGRAQRLHVVAGACSVQGPRREANEDNLYVSPDKDLFIVADGMGGHAAGEVASKFAVDVLSHELSKIACDTTDERVGDCVRSALDRAHCLILGTGASKPECRGAGTTVVLGLLLNHRLYITGVGDSRAYLIRGGSIERLTIDDSYPEAMYRLGQISAEEARRHHMRNVLMSALGIEGFHAEEEEIRVLEVYHGDRYLLASDGLTDSLEEERLLVGVRQNDNPQQAAEMLVQEAINNGAGDDVTCVMFYVQCDLSQTPAASTTSIWQRVTAVFGPRQ